MALLSMEIGLKALGYALVIFLFFGVAVALIPNPIFIRMVPANTFDYIFLGTTSLLSGLFYALPERKTCNMEKTSIGGMLLGFLAFGCPTCNKILVLLLGYTALFTIFDPLRPAIGILSVTLLLYAIRKKAESTI